MTWTLQHNPERTAIWWEDEHGHRAELNLFTRPLTDAELASAGRQPSDLSRWRGRPTIRPRAASCRARRRIIAMTRAPWQADIWAGGFGMAG